jgi:hypothetical protein
VLPDDADRARRRLTHDGYSLPVRSAYRRDPGRDTVRDNLWALAGLLAIGATFGLVVWFTR